MLQLLVRNFVHPVQDFIYPPVCLTCDQPRSDRNSRVCASCWNSLAKITSDHPVWQEISSKLKEEGVVEDLLSCFLFEKEGKLQEIVHLLKYRGVRSVGVELGRTLGGYVIRDARFASADYLIPVPLHRIKERERGYNQSDHICRGISGVTHIPIGHSLLLRTKYTQSQTKLNHEERRQNVGDAFAVHQKYRNEVGGKKLIIVDDVITTGSTINACAKVLNALGVKSVLAASAALAE